jgi:murein DD-endopeptidase MepM/ murein hydrolase activator NlpD
MSTTEFQPPRNGLDSFALAAFVLIAFGGWVLFQDYRSTPAQNLEVQGIPSDRARQASIETVLIYEGAKVKQSAPENVITEKIIIAPYNKYVITQGPHGFSYGHMAVDLSAGKGAVIKSPMDGLVTELYVDQYGNPTLVIENDFYRITMLHGKYKVEEGQLVELGQMVGRESNLGYTTDIWGYSCRNRDCGYHTHLNIFDKRLGSNINPLDVIK